jgi:hypothetical protein
MPRRPRVEEDWDGDHDPDLEDDELGLDGEEDDDLCIPCPSCGRRILEESERCPYCERYISLEDAPRTRKPIWIWAGVLACLYVVYRWIFW